MLLALHPLPAQDVGLVQSFAAAQAVHATAVSIGRIERNSISAIKLNDLAPADKRVVDKLVNMVSRQHATLQVVAGQLQLADLNAVNGTFVNDQRIESGSRRVLQEDDIVSFGGPSTISLKGESLPNPWTWRVKRLHEFLATHAPPGPLPHAQPVVSDGQPGQAANAPREVYSFSPLASSDAQQPASAHVGTLPPGAILRDDQQQFQAAQPAHMPGPWQRPPANNDDPLLAGAPAALAPAHAAPSLPSDPQPDLAPSAAERPLEDSSDEEAELAALTAYEAQLAAQQTAPPGQAGQAALLLAGQMAASLDAQQANAPGMPAVSLQPALAQDAAGAPAAGNAGAGADAVAGLQQRPSLPGALEGVVHAQPAAVRPQLPPGALPVRQRAAAQPEVVDLTADSPTSQNQQRHEEAGAPDVVDLLNAAGISPSKRQRLAAGDQGGSKRVKAAAEASTSDAASGGASTAAPPAPAAAVVGGSTAGTGHDMSAKLHQEMMCPICQELLVAAHSMVPCGHWFCGECLAGWLANGRKDCPNCRKKATAAPVLQHSINNMTDVLAKTLPPEDLEARRQKLAAWEERKGELEQQLAAPWQRNSGGARPGHDAGLLSAIAASMLGGGGLGFGAVPFSLMGPPGGAGAEMPPWGGGGARGRRSPAVVARHPPAPPPPPRLPQEFRVEFAAGPTNAHRCCGCGNMLGENLTRIGTRVQGQGGGRRGGSWRWHHLDCLPPGHWREARTTGIANLPSIPAPEQSRVRQHLSLVPR